PEKSQVTDDVDDFVPDELVGEAQRFLAQDRFTAHDDRVLEAAAFDEIFFHERLDVLVENKGAGRRDLALVNDGRDFRGKKLRELPAGPALRAGDSEFWIGQNDEERAGLRFDMNRLTHFEETARRLLR